MTPAELRQLLIITRAPGVPGITAAARYGATLAFLRDNDLLLVPHLAVPLKQARHHDGKAPA